MLRDLNVSVDGRRDSTDGRVGVLATEIPYGFPLESFLRNDIDAGAAGRLYSLEILTLPSAGTLTLDKAGVGSFIGAPVGSYTGSQRVRKFDPSVGLISTATTEYTLLVVPQPGVITGVDITPLSATDSQQFTAVVNGENDPSQEVVWSKEGGGTLSASGNYVRPERTLEEQSITIKATSVADPTKFGTATVTVAATTLPVVTGVTVTPINATIASGGTLKFDAEVNGANNPSSEVDWSTTFGAVDVLGNVTVPVVIGDDTGGAVTATSVQDPTKSGTVLFTVKALVIIGPPDGPGDPPIDPGPFPEVLTGTVQYHRMPRSKLKVIRLA